MIVVVAQNIALILGRHRIAIIWPEGQGQSASMRSSSDPIPRQAVIARIVLL
jgi:hypothetical protein